MVPIFWVFLLAFLESLLISVLIKIWLYLIYFILDGTCSSICSWHMLLKCSHRLLILVLMVLTSIKVVAASNISDFKFIISVFFQRYILCLICCWYLTYTLDSMYYISWSLTPLIGLHVVARDGMFAAKISSMFCLLVGKFTIWFRPTPSIVDFNSSFITFLH